MQNRRLSVAIAGSLVFGLAAVFAINGVEADTAQPDRGAVAHPDLLEPYPLGRWRLQSPAELGHVVLWVSHLLIRHQGSATDVPFGPPHWRSETAAPDRTREEAMALAFQASREAAKAPAEFARLVAQYSDDVASMQFGGSLGGIKASEFLDAPQILDALAQTPPGGVTRAIETRYGFHVFHRRPPPPERTVSGAHIVIGHDGARWLHEFAARRPIPGRSHQEALRIATELYAELCARPERFMALLDARSEHRDARWGGDFGSWSSREPTPFPREIEVLKSLDVGEISGPIDTGFGFQIIRRTPDRVRERYASRVLRLRFDPAAPDTSAHSRAAVRDEAKRLARDILEGKRDFGDVLHEKCCGKAILSEEGRDNLLANEALRTLGFGEVSPEPIEWDFQFQLVQRLDPRTVETPPHTLLEIPAPTKPDVAYFVTRARPDIAQFWLRQIAQEFSSTTQGLNLRARERQELVQLHQAWEPIPEASGLDGRRAAFESLLEQVKRLLGSAAFQSYISFMERTFETWGLTKGFPTPEVSPLTSASP